MPKFDPEILKSPPPTLQGRNLDNQLFRINRLNAQLHNTPYGPVWSASGNVGADIKGLGLNTNFIWNSLMKNLVATGGSASYPVTDNLRLKATYNRFGGHSPGSRKWEVGFDYKF